MSTHEPTRVVIAGAVSQHSADLIALSHDIRNHPELAFEEFDAALNIESAAQCQHLRAVSPHRVVATRGNIGQLNLSQIRETLAVILDIA